IIPDNKFQLIHRHLRPFDHTQIDETAPLPRVFQGIEEWSDHIQAVSMQLFRPGPHLAVDECIIRYTGNSDSITTIKGKPDPVGFKIWVIAQMGFYVKWLWHIKEDEYGDNDDALNSTQAVVVGLTKTLPKSTYHVFVDNLFSSTPLFRNLRKQGYEATGTARTNSGIHKELVRDKNDDGKAKRMYEFNAVKVNQMAWKDNKLVLFSFTVFTGADDERVIRQKKPSSKKSEAKPIRRFFWVTKLSK
ncbi:PiggyBac transposable element-derived protein 2, partial [Fusarium odoratissimum]